MNRIAIGLIALATLMVADSATAQTCLGSPSFRQNPYQLAVVTAFTDGARGAGGTIAAGGEALFGGAGLAVTKFTGVDTHATNLIAFAGADLPATTDPTIYFCPLAQLSIGSGPDIGNIDISTAGLEGGVNFGIVASRSGDLEVIPMFGLSASYHKVTAKVGQTENSTSDTSGAARIGVGFVFGGNVGLTPSLSIPFSSANTDPIFNLTLSLNFGR